ncbi:ATP-binding protein [Streptomyces sp. N2-109]|uniref:ATP-binding protein n=1 Tax=Streptomyces gossypii TaxID=2883101 RepID=A0ABT2JKH1_9ACTN|nr:ATP-binding protein [Streptomyces gossypii]MCT2588367.1 ATP-binding protein [Streptomyces gossypii]
MDTGRARRCRPHPARRHHPRPRGRPGPTRPHDRSLRRGRFVCVLGEAGVGKTFAVHTAARRLGELLPLDFRALPAPADLRAALHKALKLRGEAPADPGAADTLIRRTLAQGPRIVVVEDAHRLSASCFEYLRFLHDDLPKGCAWS